MKKALGFLYLIYALLLFVITMIPVAVGIFLVRLIYKEPKVSDKVHRMFRMWMGLYMPLAFCPVTHYGRSYFEKGKNYVVLINHNSYVDIPVASPGIPGTNLTLAKRELSRIPVFGYIYKAGSILLDRESSKSRKDSIRKMIDVLEKNWHLCLYPEGTRNKRNTILGTFKDGGFRVAIQTGTPIIPAVILGTKYILNVKGFPYALPHKIQFHFMEPIRTADLNLDQVNELKERVRKMMLDKIAALEAENLFVRNTV